MLMVSMIHPIVSLTLGLSIKSLRQFVSNFWPKEYKVKSTIWKRLMTFSINVYLALIGMIIYYLILMDLCPLKEHDYKNQSYDKCYCDKLKLDNPQADCNSDDEENVQNMFVKFPIKNFSLGFSLVSLACHVIHSLTIAIPPPIPLIDFILGSSEKATDEENVAIELAKQTAIPPQVIFAKKETKCKIGWSICFKILSCLLSIMFIGFLIASPYVNFGNKLCQTSNETNSSNTCQTNENKHCVFPFTYNGQVFYGCSKDKHKDFSLDEKQGWCAIDPDFKSFGICKPNCQGGKFKIF